MGNLSVDQLRQRVRGMVVTPGDEAYDEARKVYNAMIDRRPSAVVRCVNAGDVMAAVDFARENGLDLAVRGGGHSVPGFGTCDDGVVADLSAMRGVRVDPVRRTARAEGGATWGDFNEANTAWVRDYYEATAPHSEEGGYVNFMADDDQGRIRANYKGNYDRLVEVKRTYDPGNLFHLNQNIRP
ncbi:FAD-dependent oxidoreductase [Streptomyces sp. NBC_01439]|uniref:FAD-dependent oxidoreductase n=1 Tax=Streptomyces sp. NBC_01439 TaxID=2903867 RepID=UPI002E2A15F7|nr:FAD-dependent oxidoreductase [Streptomyces sp. NBC_01439]